jgi:hypothetical protein
VLVVLGWKKGVVGGKKKDEDEEGQGEAAMEIAWSWLTWLVKKTA